MKRLLISLVAAGALGAHAQNWLEDQFLKIHMELNVPHRSAAVGERFSPVELRQAMRDSHAQVVVLFGKDAYGNSFFQTKYGSMARGLQFDLVKRQVDALQELGIKVLAHYSVGDDSRIDLSHPEWLCEDLNGKPLRGGPISNRACLNSPYGERMLLPQLEELTRLGLDGLWLDIFRTPEGCFCQHCRRKFRARYGTDLSPDDSRRFLFWQESADELLAEINRRTKAINPRLVITFNGAHLLRHAKDGLVDFFTAESHVNPDTGYEIHQIQARYLRALGVPFDIQNMTNNEKWDDSTLKSAAQLQLEFSQIISQGGRISAGTQLYPWGEYERAAAQILGQAYEFIEARLPYVSKARSKRFAAILVPDVSPGTGSWRIGSELGLVGLASALSEMHLQFDILDGSNGGYDLLPDYELAILPQPEATFQALEGRKAIGRFAQAGGKLLLISSGNTTLELGALGLPVRVRRQRCVRGALHVQATGFEFPFQGALVTLEGTTVTRVAGLRCGDLDLPALELLAGNVAYIGWPIGRLYHETGYPEWRVFLREALAALRPQFPYIVDGPANLNVNLMERPEEYLLHLVNLAAPKGLPHLMPYVRDVPSLYDISVRVRCPRPAGVFLEPAGRELKFTYADGAASFRVPEVQIYEIVRIAWNQ